MTGDLKALQGSWAITALELDGKAVPAAMLQGSRIVVKRSRFETESMGASYRGTVSVDERAKPKRFDLAFTAGPEKGTTNLGIYELDGDTWRLCFDTTGRSRPRSFATRAGSGFALETLQRAGATKPARKPTIASAPASEGHPTELEGEWAMVSGVMDGVAMDQAMVAWARRVTRGNETSVMAGPKELYRFRFTLGEGSIDYLALTGPREGSTQLGIFVIDGGTLRLCVAPPGKARPKSFTSKPGDGRMLTTWRRR